MNYRDLIQQLQDDALSKFNADVVVIDADGFTHVPLRAYWSAEDARWVIQTRWQTDDEVTLNGPGYPAQ
jgi:hypothetical protein